MLGNHTQISVLRGQIDILFSMDQLHKIVASIIFESDWIYVLKGYARQYIALELMKIACTGISST